MILPARDDELDLLRRHEAVVGIDEVGRGALAGPVCVGAAVVTRSTPNEHPAGLRDSKLLSAPARERLVEPIHAWLAGAGVVGEASPAEIDALGIVDAMRLAAARALTTLTEAGHVPGAVLLDGSHDWLQPGLLDHLPDFAERRVVVKGDARCSVIAAASVLAKVHRDRLMAAEPDPGYGWADHKGYGSAVHLAALAARGPSEFHRRTWKLPGVQRVREA